MWRRVAIGLVILAIVAAGVGGIFGSIDDPTAAGRDGESTLFVEPRGTGPDACGEYVATWLDLLHADGAFPIDDLKADVGQGPLWVTVMGVWRTALDLETRLRREEVARRLVPEIAAACEDPDVRAQFTQLGSN